MKHGLLMSTVLLLLGSLALGREEARRLVGVTADRSVVAVKNGDFHGGIEFEADLTGDQEVPSVDTITRGEFEIKFNSDLTAARFELEVFDGTSITQAHLHCAPAGVNGPVVAFLFGNVPGGFHVDGDLAEFTITDANIAAVGANCVPHIGMAITNLADLLQAMMDGNIYANVHSVDHPGGEVRGQLVGEDEDEDDEDDDENEDDDEDDD